MALTLDPNLQARLAGLGINEPLPEIAAADVQTKPIDIYRLHFASTLASIIGCDVSAAYNAMAGSSDLDLADLTIILPKLKPKEVTDVKAWAFDIIKKVCISSTAPTLWGLIRRLSYLSHLFSRCRMPMGSNFESSSQLNHYQPYFSLT